MLADGDGLTGVGFERLLGVPCADNSNDLPLELRLLPRDGATASIFGGEVGGVGGFVVGQRKMIVGELREKVSEERIGGIVG